MDPDNELLWAYFFIDNDTTKLRILADHLVSKGYTFNDIFELEADNISIREFTLQVERIEQHSLESLQQRNQEFYNLAIQFSIQDYDGMEAGPVQ